MFDWFIDRPLACAALGMAGALAGGLRFPGDGPVTLACLGAALILTWKWRGRSTPAALCFLAAGLAFGSWRGRSLDRALDLPEIRRLQAMHLSGQVFEDEGFHAAQGSQALVLDRCLVTDLAADPRTPEAVPQPLAGKVRVSFQPSPSQPQEFGPGDWIEWEGALRPPGPPTNPGEFDYRHHLRVRGIRALASVRYGTVPRFLRPASGFQPSRWVWRWRKLLESGLAHCLPDASEALGRGILLGDKSGLPAAELTSFSRSGLSYLLAVAGLHLVLAAWLFLKLASRWIASRRKQALTAMAVVLAYALATGLQVPALRAGSMFLLLMAARLASLETDFATSFSFGFLLVLGLQPFALAEPGFQFSFGTTAAIVAFLPGLRTFSLIRLGLEGQGFRERLGRWFLGLVLAALCAQVAVVPITAWHFNQFSWVAVLASLAVSPFFILVIGLGLASAVLAALWAPLAWLTAAALQACLGMVALLVHFFAHLPGACLSVGRPSWLWMAAWSLMVCAATLAFQRKVKPAGWTAAAVFLVCLVWLIRPALSRIHPGVTRAWFFDVGQGDSILVEFGDGKTLLVDGGNGRPDAGSWVLAPALRRLGISSLDWVALSHPHADHLGGLASVLDGFPVRQVLDSGQAPPLPGPAWETFEKAVASSKAQRRSVRQGTQEAGHWTVYAPFLHPLQGTKNDLHNNNLVLRVEDWLWLGGDMEKEGEARLVQGGLPQVRLLKVSHHGSATSTTPAFLKALKPEMAVISCGRDNRFGFPRVEVLRRLKGLRLYRTDLDGCVSAEKSAAGLGVQTFLSADESLRWQAPPRPTRGFWKRFERKDLEGP
jgi:competence protein ComEC